VIESEPRKFTGGGAGAMRHLHLVLVEENERPAWPALPEHPTWPPAIFVLPGGIVCYHAGE
jgi:hypothetical protein